MYGKKKGSRFDSLFLRKPIRKPFIKGILRQLLYTACVKAASNTPLTPVRRSVDLNNSIEGV